VIEWLTIAFKILGKIPGVAGYALPMLERCQFKRLAVDLATLSFWKDGMVTPIEKIASGGGDQEDLKELSKKLEQTKPEVDKGLWATPEGTTNPETFSVMACRRRSQVGRALFEAA